MSDDVLVKVDNVSKRFCRRLKRSLWYGLQDLGSEIGGRRHGRGSGLPQRSADLQLRPDEFWAVKDVSFELRRGECLGLIGRNGAGKTTLLRMLNGLIKPDTGAIEMHGRVGALIALGAGFNPLLTGKENIYVNASIIGLSDSETDELIDEIVDFANLRDAIDSPVGTYSSGMSARLGFAVATSFLPDILIIDEVLAVGDTDFRLKSMKRMQAVVNEGSAVILVSHSMTDVHNMSSQCVWLDKGETRLSGNSQQVISCYLGDGIKSSKERLWNDNKNAPGCDSVRLKKISAHAPDNQDISIDSGVFIEFDIACSQEGLSLDWTLELSSEERIIIFHTGDKLCPPDQSKIALYSVNVEIPPHLLNAGSYYVSLIIGESQAIPLVNALSAINFDVKNISIGSNYDHRPGLISPQLKYSVTIRN